MKTITDQKIKTYLPVFSGFYNTVWQFKDENILYDVNDTRKENGLPELESDENFDIAYNEYENDVSKELCKVLQENLSDFVEMIEFENVYSPKTYNFSTDSINCIIETKPEAIKEFIYKNKGAFSEYLKNKYTSCDGFIAGYGNRFENWKKYTNNFNDFTENEHYLGAILDFICIENGIDTFSLYSEVMEGIYTGNYLTNYADCYECLTCDTCGKFVKDYNIKNDIVKYKELMKKYPANVLCVECLENI